MANFHWKTPPIIQLLLKLRLATERERKKSIEEKLNTAKRTLDAQLKKLKDSSNG
jgi:hypothetical protein